MTDQEILEALSSTDIPKFTVAEDAVILDHWGKEGNMTGVMISVQGSEVECCGLSNCGGFCRS